jgi:outer membrane protein assembly factor BamB
MKLVRIWTLVALLWGVGGERARAVDWPQWRFNAGHTADSTEELSTNLTLSWVREYGPRVPVWEDPLNQDLMPFDSVFEPVVLGERMFLGFNDRDKVVALNIRSGRELWAFYTDGPVRLAPAAADGKVCFASDDGCLYCVRAEDGGLLWKFRGGPSPRKVLGNSRLISAWPARGGPVIKDKVVYFAASIWPFMGTFIYALELETGRVQWVNDGNGPQYMKQPHSAPAFGGVAPQGMLAATEKMLLVPGGRSAPAAFDRSTGQFLYFHLAETGKGNGGSLLLANESLFFIHTRNRGTRGCELAQGKKTDFVLNEPVLGSNFFYGAAGVSQGLKQVRELEQKLKFENYDVLRTKDELAEVMGFGDAKAIKDSSNAWHSAEKKVLKRQTELADARKKLDAGADNKVIQAWRADKSFRWETPGDGTGDLIRAGHRLYAAGSNTITTIQLSATNHPERVWSQPVEGPVGRLLAANGMLFAVTLDGRIMAFTDGRAAGWTLRDSFPRPVVPAAARARAETILAQTGVRDGYAFCLGLENGDLITALAAASNLHLVGVDQDSKKVERLRRRLDALGLYGTRISLLAGAPEDFGAPPYMASLVVVEESVAARLAAAATARKVYETVRPYGGALWVNGPRGLAGKFKNAGLAQAEVKTVASAILIRRTGPLPGSADWTHQYGDVGNSVKSDDQLVKLPLGLLWFGGNTHLDVLPRHGHGPSPQVAAGRLFLEGMDCLSARDVYTGRRLWKTVVPGLNNEGVYYSETYTNDPLTTVFNQRHITGANGRGANFVVTADRVYVAVSNHCAVLDSATGKILMNIPMPAGAEQAAAGWGYIGVSGDVLLGGAGFADFSKRLQPPRMIWPPPAADLAASKGLVAFNRHTGKVLWQVEARHSFIHNGLIAGQGKVFCLDRHPKSFEGKLQEQRDKAAKDKAEKDKDKGKSDNAPKESDKKDGEKRTLPYRVVAFDLRTGRQVWEQTNLVSSSWLGYSKENEVILLAGASATDRLRDETSSSMEVLQAGDGAVVWKRAGDLKHGGPCILYHDLIITTPSSYKVSAGAYGLLDGKPQEIPNPLTGAAQPWKFYRGYGCNYPIASEHLMTFRSGAAGFYDLDEHSGQGSFGGFKSSCSANLIAADGVLNAPDYTRTCSCPYQNQTSLAFVPMPENEMWTCNFSGLDQPEGKRIQRLGLNLGAPGDRVAEDGTVWLEYPANSGVSPHLFVALDGGDTPCPPTNGVTAAETNQLLHSVTSSNFFRHHMSAVSGGGPAWVMASGIRNLRTLVVAPQTRRALPPPDAPKDDDDEFDKRPGGAVDDNDNETGIKDVTKKVTELVKDDALSFDVTSALLGNPAPGIPKQFRVEYSIDGVEASKTVDANTKLTLSAKDKSPTAKLVIRKAVYGLLTNEVPGEWLNINGSALIGRWLSGPTNLAETSGFSPPGYFDGVAEGTNAKALAWSTNVPPGFTGRSLDLRAGHVGVKIKHTQAKERGYRNTFDRPLASRLTVAFWANGYPGAWRPFVSKHGEGGEGWQIRDKNGSGNPTFTLRGTGDDDPDSSIKLKDKPGWHHIAAVFDGAAGIRQLYVDGKLSLNVSNRFGKIGNAKNSSLELGARDGDVWFQGRLFDVRIYNYPLSAGEVKALLDPAAKDIYTFDFDTLGEATVSGTNILLTVEPGALLTNLAPTFTMAPAATASPRSGTTRDFTTPQTYTVTARDGSTKDYVVTVSVGSKRNGNGHNGPRRGLTADEIRTLKQMPILPKTNYTVRLYFLEPDEVKPGQRVFDVLLQDRPALSGFDIVKETGGAKRGVVKEFKQIEITKELEVRLERASTSPLGPVLSGVELILESGPR